MGRRRICFDLSGVRRARVCIRVLGFVLWDPTWRADSKPTRPSFGRMWANIARVFCSPLTLTSFCQWVVLFSDASRTPLLADAARWDWRRYSLDFAPWVFEKFLGSTALGDQPPHIARDRHMRTARKESAKTGLHLELCIQKITFGSSTDLMVHLF